RARPLLHALPLPRSRFAHPHGNRVSGVAPGRPLVGVARVKVGILSQWYDPEPGSAAVPGVLARGLRQRGHSVQVVTGFPNYPTGTLAPGYRIRRHVDEDREGIA